MVRKRILATTYIQTIYASAINEQGLAAATQELSQILRASHKLNNNDQDDYNKDTNRAHQYIQQHCQLLTVLLAAIPALFFLP